MPFEEIGFERASVEGRVRVGTEFMGFFQDPFDGRGFGIERWESHVEDAGNLRKTPRQISPTQKPR